MNDYTTDVINELVNLGQTFEQAENSVNQIDTAHYEKFHFADELAEMIVWFGIEHLI